MHRTMAWGLLFSGRDKQVLTMPFNARYLRLAAIAALGLAPLGAQAQVAAGSTDYNHPYGMSSDQSNDPVNASLRDSNGNLTVVNGVFTSSSFSQQSGVQQAGMIGSGATASGAGFGGATAMGSSGSTSIGGVSATSVGNSLNVVTIGNNNTVVVDSNQTNNGNQTASVNLDGK
ncbi:MAG TPA: holdfast anchoring protein HfaA [Rhizomicrobium sp.]